MKRKREGVIAYYPVSLNIVGRKCIVAGGGEVALRKVKVLLEHGAEVEVISPDLCPELARLAESGEISVCNHAYEMGNLAGAFLAIAATDDAKINRQIAAEARSKAILVNVVDDAVNSDFIVPSYLRRMVLLLQSPPLAKAQPWHGKSAPDWRKELMTSTALLPASLEKFALK